jgi:hypothetical protein
MPYNPERLALHGEGFPSEVLPPDPENSREARAGRARLAMLAGHPDLDEQKTASALALLEDTTEEPAGNNPCWPSCGPRSLLRPQGLPI